MTKVFTKNNNDFDDYVIILEIGSILVLEMLKEIISVFEPYRYSRVILKKEFSMALKNNLVIIVLFIY